MSIVLSKDEIKKLISLLDTVYQNDQRYRQDYQIFIDKYDEDSNETKNIADLIKKNDEENLKIIKKIIDDYGWLGSDIIGFKGNQTLFLVIQHADIKTQIKYFPIMKKAAEIGDARKCDLALLEDRIALRQEKKQIYGTQLLYDEKKQEYYVAPLINPLEVDKRRKEVGLNSIDEYISNWGLTWDYEEGKSKSL